jgi:hypothetical protein
LFPIILSQTSPYWPGYGIFMSGMIFCYGSSAPIQYTTKSLPK